MFLKSLTIKGFKSFADVTTLEFEPGVTVVVGPNGSGKSNVVDAVAWVLGAQGPRTLRSAKMEEVIFAGTPNRQPLGRAEVSLTIDNSAGLLPIDFSEVTITRTLFRSGDSEYAINSVPCRLLEIQELLSDTGVGRQQHVIVSQGNLDSVLNARPEERRHVVEEAAGILKYRRRKEKAERRLESTEAGLVRLQDLLREVRRQLRPLERQADAARRHGDVVSELNKVRRYLLGRDLAAVESKVRVADSERRQLRESEAVVRKALVALDAEVLTAEALLEDSLASRRAPDPGDLTSSAESTLARAVGIAAVIAERRRSLDREVALGVDSGVVASLDAEAAALRARLEDTEAVAAGLLPEADSLAESENLLAAEEARLEARWGARPPSDRGDPAAEVRGELAALRATSGRSAADAARLAERLQSLGERLSRLSDESERLVSAIAAARAAEGELGSRAGLSRSAEADGERDLRDAEDALRAADAGRSRWAARAEALESSLGAARARAGAQRLAEVSGVLGTLLDLVEVDEGYELAFEAAAGEVLGGVVVDNPSTGRRAIEFLRSANSSGAVIPLRAPRAERKARPLGEHESLRARVRAQSEAVEALLDEVLGGVVVVDVPWQRALDRAIAQPDLVVVTLEGDRFAGGMWWTGAGRDGATGAALDEARRRAVAAKQTFELASQALSTARSVAVQRRSERFAAERALESNTSRIASSVEALRRSDAERGDLEQEHAALAEQREEVLVRQAREQSRLAELESLLPDLERRAVAHAEQLSLERSERAVLTQRALDVATTRRDLEVRAAALEERRELTERRLAEVEDRLRRNVAERDHASARRTAAARAVAVCASLAELIEVRIGSLRETVSLLRAARDADVAAERRRGAELESLRRRRSSVERELSETLERSARAEVEGAEMRLRLEAIVDSIRRDLDSEPDAVRDAPHPDLPPGTSATSRRVELERELRLMGPINPLALEEHEALMERNRFLDAQLEDVRNARRELAKVIRAVDSEIVEMFQAAYADVADNFAKLFSTLFPGGEGRLRLTEPENPLETGIDIEARPSGKNLRRLSLLSGGERSLAAMAFLFAVFRSRPSPFYMLDEVEAALDDVNLHRFLDLVHEFRDEAQLLIVSHQKRTMEAADCLYGVTMAPGGSSRVISERIAPAEGRTADVGGRSVPTLSPVR